MSSDLKIPPQTYGELFTHTYSLDDEETAALKARIRELEAQVVELETRLAEMVKAPPITTSREELYRHTYSLEIEE